MSFRSEKKEESSLSVYAIDTQWNIVFFNCMCCSSKGSNLLSLQITDYSQQYRAFMQTDIKSNLAVSFLAIWMVFFLMYCISLEAFMFFFNFLNVIRGVLLGNCLLKMFVVKSSVINTWHILQSAPSKKCSHDNGF